MSGSWESPGPRRGEIECLFVPASLGHNFAPIRQYRLAQNITLNYSTLQMMAVCYTRQTQPSPLDSYGGPGRYWVGQALLLRTHPTRASHSLFSCHLFTGTVCPLISSLSAVCCLLSTVCCLLSDLHCLVNYVLYILGCLKARQVGCGKRLVGWFNVLMMCTADAVCRHRVLHPPHQGRTQKS